MSFLNAVPVIQKAPHAELAAQAISALAMDGNGIYAACFLHVQFTYVDVQPS